MTKSKKLGTLMSEWKGANLKKDFVFEYSLKKRSVFFLLIKNRKDKKYFKSLNFKCSTKGWWSVIKLLFCFAFIFQHLKTQMNILLYDRLFDYKCECKKEEYNQTHKLLFNDFNLNFLYFWISYSYLFLPIERIFDIISAFRKLFVLFFSESGEKLFLGFYFIHEPSLSNLLLPLSFIPFLSIFSKIFWKLEIMFFGFLKFYVHSEGIIFFFLFSWFTCSFSSSFFRYLFNSLFIFS